MKKISIGGQALIEGLLMIGPKNAAIAVRKPDGSIVVDKRPNPPKSIFLKIPVLRGIRAFFRQMVLGVKALMYSAELAEIEDDSAEPSRFERFIERLFGDKLKDVVIYFSVIIAICFSVGMFILLPNLLAGFLRLDKNTARGTFLSNLLEGLIRMLLFLGYLVLVSGMKDIRRVWQYHGAEHKTIHAYEHGDELTVENIKKYSTKHPRCGTSFLFLVMIISIITFSLLGWHSTLVNIISRLVLVPFVAGVAYEILKLAGQCEWKVMKIIKAPGLAFQYLTTREPDDEMIEVAIEALKNLELSDNAELPENVELPENAELSENVESPEEKQGEACNDAK